MNLKPKLPKRPLDSYNTRKTAHQLTAPGACPGAVSFLAYTGLGNTVFPAPRNFFKKFQIPCHLLAFAGHIEVDQEISIPRGTAGEGLRPHVV